MSEDEKLNILIVDDDERNLMALKSILVDLGQNVVSSTSGEDALMQILRTDFTVILLDIQMPGMDGFETARLIRSRERSKHIPIIFLTAFGKNDSFVKEGYSIGAVDYLFKPIEPEILKSKIRTFLELERKAVEVKRFNRLLLEEKREKDQALEARSKKAEELMHLNEELEASRRHITAILDCSADSILTIDEKGRILSSNHAFIETFGHSDEEVRDMGLLELLKDATIPDMDAVIPEERQGPGDPAVRQFECSSPKKGGEMMRLEVRVRRVEGAVTPDRVYSVTIRDVTERMRDEDLKAKLMADLGRSNKDLERLAYIASHDLQEPLRMISSFIKLFVKRYKGKIDGEAEEYIQYIVEGAERMEQLIMALLDYSRVGSRELSIQKFESGDALSDAIRNLNESIKENDAEITHDGLPVIWADRVQTTRLFQNLIGNAIKFRGVESCRIHVSVTDGEDDWTFGVKDNGIGIEKDYHDKIFEVFRRLHTRSEYPGSGIGLAVCKRVVEGWGGRMWVESELGKGSTFHFTIRKDRN